MEEAEAISGDRAENPSMDNTRKEKRKERKKMKRKQLRKEAAEREREAEEARLNDPDEFNRLEREEEEERERREKALKEFEERERAWIETMERKRQEAEAEAEAEAEENARKDLEERANGEKENEDEDDDDWEYVEEGPAEIIWQGNEIIVRKKKVRVPKKHVDQTSKQEHADRPTSNPLPPQSDAFADYLNASSAQQVLETVAKEIPNFGTEQDKAHCPFHLKTGACRFGQRCSRVHFYPDKSCTLLIRNMYTGPGLAWDQDEGLEHTDEDVERSYEEFYEDVHTEFLKFGEIVNFKACKNGSFHLRGNVYVHYKSLESAVLAYHSVNGRYFASKLLNCEFVNVTKWKVAICGEFMKSRLKTCSHGSACNFIHCFRNPGGDYEWADWDKPPPRYWVKKMAALFGYSDESSLGKEIEHGYSGQPRNSSKMITSDADRSRDMDKMISDSGRSFDNEDNIRGNIGQKRHINDERKYAKVLDEKFSEARKSYQRNYLKRCVDTSDGSCSDMDMDGYRDSYQVQRSNHVKKSSKHCSEVLGYSDDDELNKNSTSESGSGGDCLDKYKSRRSHLGHTKKISRHRRKGEFQNNEGDSRNKTYKDDGGQLNRNKNFETHHGQTQKSSQHRMEPRYPDEQQDSKGRGHESDSSEMESSGGREKKRHHHHRRRHSGHWEKVLEVHDDSGSTKFRPHGSHSSDNGFDLDREIPRTQMSSLSQDSNELLEQQAKELKGKSDARRYGHSSSRHHAGIETNGGGCHSEGVKSGRKCNSSDLERSNLDNLGDLDRWKPEKGLDEGVNELDRWKPESPEERATTGYKSGSRDHSQSGCKRHSKHKEKETDSSEEYGEKHHIERGSHHRKRRRKK
ncbi:hypothetical protein SLA2020_086580 [Shorea laevis]